MWGAMSNVFHSPLKQFNLFTPILNTKLYFLAVYLSSVFSQIIITYIEHYVIVIAMWDLGCALINFTIW